MFKLKIDDARLIAKLSDLEKRQLPFATMLALNDAMFAVHKSWRDEIPRVFDQPTELTRGAVRYTKAKKDNLVAEVFILQEAHKGTPPARYLISEVAAGPRAEKPLEFALRAAGILAGDEFVVPARGFPLDQFGNVPAGVVTTILADLQALRDKASRSTAESRKRRGRKRDFAKRSTYFESAPKLSAARGHHQPLPRAIYQKTPFASGTAIRMAFLIIKGAPTYRRRLDAFGLAQRSFSEAFPHAFRERLRFAVATARVK